MNIAQIKQDLDNGVMIGRETWRDLVEWALTVDEKIDQAILAEREACAKIAETAYGFGTQVTARDVTANIRKRKESP